MNLNRTEVNKLLRKAVLACSPHRKINPWDGLTWMKLSGKMREKIWLLLLGMFPESVARMIANLLDQHGMFCPDNLCRFLGLYNFVIVKNNVGEVTNAFIVWDRNIFPITMTGLIQFDAFCDREK